MQHFTPKHTLVHSIIAHTASTFGTQHTYIFLLHDSTHFTVSASHTRPQHTSITHSHSPTHTFQFFSIQVRFITAPTHKSFFRFCYVHTHTHTHTHTYIYIYIYIYSFTVLHVHTYIFTYNKTCLSLLHLNIYLYIHIRLFFDFRKLTRFFLDEISVALISFLCYCQPNSRVSSNHIKREGFLCSTR